MADKAGCRCRPVAGEPSHDRPLPRNEDAKVDANFLTHLISGAPVAFGSEGAPGVRDKGQEPGTGSNPPLDVVGRCYGFGAFLFPRKVTRRKRGRVAAMASDYLAKIEVSDLRCRFDEITAILDERGQAVKLTVCFNAFDALND
jgi:hypothetical protein